MTRHSQEVVAVVGVATNGVIGKDGSIPWHSSVDMKHFRSITTGNPVVMGRKTFESIGKLLPDRLNVILTKKKSYQVPGALVVHSKGEALAKLTKYPKLMIIGGDQVYREFYGSLTRIELTHLSLEADGDSFFQLDPSRDWKIATQTEAFDEKLNAKLEFRTYVLDDAKDPYLSKDVKGLLKLFGSGKPIPGSGAAAALQALLAAYLILTVIQMSRAKSPTPASLKTMAQYAYRASSAIVPRLRTLFLQDIEVFEGVVPLRLAHQAATGSEKARIKRQLNARTSAATAVPDEVFELAQELLGMAEFLYLRGYKAIRGDSGAAMSAALSAMLSCSFVIGMNAGSLQRTQGESWSSRASLRRQQSMAALARIPTYLSVDRPVDTAQLTLGL